jgi:hypothetical protein
MPERDQGRRLRGYSKEGYRRGSRSYNPEKVSALFKDPFGIRGDLEVNEV